MKKYSPNLEIQLSLPAGGSLAHTRPIPLFARIASAAVLASVACALNASAATLLSSAESLSQPVPSTRESSFPSSPSPKSASVVLPLTTFSDASELPPPRKPQPAETESGSQTATRTLKAAVKKNKAAVSQSEARRDERSSVAGNVKRREKKESVTHDEDVPVARAENRDVPEPAPQSKAVVTTAESVWSVNLGWGWYNKYYFRGVDILKAVSPEHLDSGVVTSKAVLAYTREKDSFSIGFGYVQALERQIPKGAALSVKPNNTVRVVGKGKNPADTFVPKLDGEKFNLPPGERYAEYDLYLSYTRVLIPGKLLGTVNYSHYQFSDGSFYGTERDPIRYTDETTVRLDYTGLPFVHPSLAWAHDFNGFKGDYLELRVDGGFDLVKPGKVRIEPYVALSYDLKYNGVDNGWNALEFGLSAPVRFNDNFTLTFIANYTQQLEDSNGQARANDGFWGGVAFNAAWGTTGKSKSPPGSSDMKDIDKMIAMPGKEKPWAISTGVGWRNVDYDFQHRSVGAFNTSPDTGALYNRKTGKGDIGFASQGAARTYDDGTVFAGTPQSAGTANLKISKQAQVTGNPVISSNAQVTFSTTDFAYRQDHSSFSTSTDDQDTIASPYLTLDREVWRSGSESVRAGLLYSFSYSEGDSGTRLAQLDSLFQHRDKFGYTYTFDEVRTNVNPGDGFNSKKLTGSDRAVVVLDANLYATTIYQGGITTDPANFLFNTAPQKTQGTTDKEKVRVAAFVRTEVSVSTHDLALPIAFRHDFGKRLHAEMSIAPTLTVVSADIHTDVELRDLDNKTTKINPLPAGVPPQGTINPFIPANTPGATPPRNPVTTNRVSVIPPVVNNRQNSGNQANVGGGKSGSNVKEPNLPGKRLDRRSFDSSSTDLLAGFAGSVSLILDLNEEGTFYAEFWGRYQWVEDLSVSNGHGSSDIDLSGFQGGVGVGIRF